MGWFSKHRAKKISGKVIYKSGGNHTPGEIKEINGVKYLIIDGNKVRLDLVPESSSFQEGEEYGG